MITIATLDFLRDLKNNNNRPWFEAHREQYERAHNNVKQLASRLLLSLIPEEPDLARLDAKDCLFRIYRDTRFGPDKTPYKTNMGISISSGMKGEVRAGYYIHIEPNDNSFIAGGIYNPNPTDLGKIRQEIDYNLSEWKAILDHPDFQDYFGTLQPDAQMLKTIPRGFDVNSPAASFLKMKSYIASSHLTDAELVSSTLVNQLFEGMDQLRPLLKFLNRGLGHQVAPFSD